MLDPDVLRFVAYLESYAVGQAHAQPAVSICQGLGLEPSERNRRVLRAWAADALDAGHLVCADGHGYFIPTTPQELDAATRPWKSQARAMSRRVRKMEELAVDRFELRDEPEPEAPRPALFALMEAHA